MAKQPKQDRENGSANEHELVTVTRGLAEIFAQHDLTELVVDTKDSTFTLRRGGAVVAQQAPQYAPAPQYAAPQFASAPQAAHAPAAAAVVDDKSHVVTSPFVGTFYRKPNPDSANYVSIGDKVDKGAVLCIVEAMKLMNEIEADVAGTITGILVEDGTSVEYGQPLFKIA